MKTPRVKTSKKPTRYRLIRSGLYAVIVIIVAGTGTYIALAAKNEREPYNSTATRQLNVEATPPAKIDNSSSPSVNTGADSSPATDSSGTTSAGTTSITPAAPTFTFVDTAQWATENSRDGSFSIKYIPSLVYATCPDLADNLMVAMAGPSSNNITCGSLQKAVSVQPYNGQSNVTVLRTETAIAQTDDAWDHSGATPVTVTLAGGQTAQRYDYTSVILGATYRTIEYDTTVDGKRYIAVDNWQDTKSPNTSVNDFDTMIQKTWIFN